MDSPRLLPTSEKGRPKMQRGCGGCRFAGRGKSFLGSCWRGAAAVEQGFPALVEAFSEGADEGCQEVGRKGRHFLFRTLVGFRESGERCLEYFFRVGGHEDAFIAFLCFILRGDKAQDF